MIVIINKYLLIILGTISLIFGAIGVFVPILPTTPFILLASFCYLRSSKRLYKWIIGHKVFGKFIYNYIEHKAVKKSAKISAITFLWLSLGISIVLNNSLNIRLLLTLIGIGVSLYLFRLNTLPND